MGEPRHDERASSGNPQCLSSGLYVPLWNDLDLNLLRLHQQLDLYRGAPQLMQIINANSGVTWTPLRCEISAQVLPKQCGYFCFMGMSDGLLSLIMPGDVRISVVYNPATQWIAGELYIATSANPPDGTAQTLTIASRALMSAMTSPGPKGKAGSWTNTLPASKPIWVGCRFDYSGEAPGMQAIADRAWLGTLRVNSAAQQFAVGAQLTTVGDVFVPHYRYSS